jgi:hypothetical protein
MNEVLDKVIITGCDSSRTQADLSIGLITTLQTEESVIVAVKELKADLMHDILLSQYPHGVDHQFPEFLFRHFHDIFYFARQSVLAKGRKHMCYVQENSIGEIRIVTVCIHPLTRLGDGCTLK